MQQNNQSSRKNPLSNGVYEIGLRGVKLTNVVKCLLYNAGITGVGFGFASFGVGLDSLLGWRDFRSLPVAVAGSLLVAMGLVLRMWALYLFHERQMTLFSFVPQRLLITTGPYSISRNPLYLGANVFIGFGAAACLGSPAGILIILLHLPLMDLFIRREEKRLEREFGEDWVRYKSQVARWINH